MKLKFFLFLLILIAGVFSFSFVFNSTSDFDGGSFFNTSTATSTYNFTANATGFDFPYASKDVNLVSYWRFEDNANDEKGANDLTGTNAAYATGKFGQGAVFDGSTTRVYTGTNIDTLPKTLDLWFKTGNISQDAVIAMTGRHDDDSTIEVSLYYSHDDIYFGNENYKSTLHNISKYFFDNAWNMVTVEMDSSHNIQVFINGYNLTSQLIDYSYMWNEADNVVVGAREYSGSWSRLFNGTIDEIKVYNKALSQEEINNLYNQYLPSGLVSYWKLDGDAVDENGLNNGTVNGATVDTSGRYGSCYDFNGTTDYIEFSDSNSLDALNGSLTIGAWFNLRGVNKRNTFFEKGHEGTNDLVWLYHYNQSGDSFYLFEVGDGVTRDYARYDSLPDLNKWYFIVGVYNVSSKKISLYLDGVLVGEKDSSVNFINTSAYKASIGSYYDGSDHFLNGSIDDVQVYNKSLTSSEVSQLYERSVKYKWNGSWLSSEVDFPFWHELNNLTLYYEDVDNNTYVDKVEVINSSSGSVLSTCSVDLNSPNPYELSEHSLRNDNNLVSYWKFENDATDELDSNNLTNSGVSFVSGKFNQASYFDGNSYAYANDFTSGWGEITLGAWVKLDSTTNDQALFGHWSDGQMLLYHDDPSGWRFVVEDDSSNLIDSGYDSNGASSTGEWMFIVGTYNKNGHISLYKNGGLIAQDSTAPSGNPILTGTDHFFVGADGNAAARKMHGTIDDAFVFNRSLNASEISNLYEENKKVFSSNDFDNGFSVTNSGDVKFKVFFAGNGSSSPVLFSMSGESVYNPQVDETVVVSAPGFNYPLVIVLFVFAVFLFWKI